MSVMLDWGNKKERLNEILYFSGCGEERERALFEIEGLLNKQLYLSLNLCFMPII